MLLPVPPLQYRCLHNYAVLSLLWHAKFRFRYFIAICLFTAKTAQPEACPSPPLRWRRLPQPRPGEKHASPRRRRRPLPASWQVPAPPAPATATSREAARPSSLQALAAAAGPSSPPAPAAASFRPAMSHGHVPWGSAPVLVAGIGRDRRPVLAAFACRGQLPPSAEPAGAGRGQRSLSSPVCTSSSPRPSQQVVPAAGGHVPHARRRRCCGPLLRHKIPTTSPQRAAGGARRGHVCVGIAGRLMAVADVSFGTQNRKSHE